MFEEVIALAAPLKIFVRLSLNSLHNASAILDEDSFGLQFVILAVVGFVLFGALYIFKHKDLPL
ncbi:MAG: hypothetical protein AB2L21_09910 [Anaerolineaceae bacterium]|jgi:hypothetical protein